jgi:hypothetical protein
MKHLVQKININKLKEQLKTIRFALPELIVGIVIGLLIGGLL